MQPQQQQQQQQQQSAESGVGGLGALANLGSLDLGSLGSLGSFGSLDLLSLQVCVCAWLRCAVIAPPSLLCLPPCSCCVGECVRAFLDMRVAMQLRNQLLPCAAEFRSKGSLFVSHPPLSLKITRTNRPAFCPPLPQSPRSPLSGLLQGLAHAIGTMPANQSSAHAQLQTLASLLGAPAEQQQRQQLQEQGPGSALQPLPSLLLLESWLAAATGQAPQQQVQQQQHESQQQPQQAEQVQPSREQRWRPHVPLPGPSDRAARRQQAGLPLRTPPEGLSQPPGECRLATGLPSPPHGVAPLLTPPPLAVPVVQ